MPRRRGSEVLALVLLAAAAHAAPTTGDAAQAEALFQKARALMDDGNYDAACPLLTESYRLDPGLGTLMNLAACHEGEGRIATAWAEYHDVVAQARRDGMDDRARSAILHIADIAPRLPHVTVLVMNSIPGLTIRRDDTELAKVTWQTPIPIDPGRHVFVASAPGRVTFTKTVVVQETQSVTVTVPDLVDAAPPAPAVKPPLSTTRRTAGLVIGAGGVAAVAVGSVAGLVARSKSKDVDALCPDGACRSASDRAHAQDLQRSGKTWATAGTVSFGVGIAGVGVGAALLLLGQDREGTGARVYPSVGQGSGAIQLEGRW